MSSISIGISVLALLISGLSLWLANFRRGRLRVTRPTVIFFGPDGSEGGISKIYLRTLLYCTAKRGIVVENLYVRLRRGELQQNFNIWVYGDKELARGSGLFVSHEGIATNHHFLQPTDIATFAFSAGHYTLDILVKTIDDVKPRLLTSCTVNIDAQEASRLADDATGIYFDWGPDSGRYVSKIDNRPPKVDPLELLKALQAPSYLVGPKEATRKK
jgi:hypothetical protein